MAGTLTNQSATASPFHSYTPSATVSQSLSYTMWAPYYPNISNTVSSSPSASPSPIYSASPFTGSLSLPTISASSTHLAPVIAVVQDTVTISKQDLIYLCVPIGFVFLVALSFAYNAYSEKKRLKKLVSQYKYTAPTVKMNPVNLQNHDIV
jgi:hypothetical protein